MLSHLPLAIRYPALALPCSSYDNSIDFHTAIQHVRRSQVERCSESVFPSFCYTIGTDKPERPRQYPRKVVQGRWSPTQRLSWVGLDRPLCIGN